MILIILLYGLFGTSFLFNKALLNYANPIFLTGARMTISGILLLGYQYFYAYKNFKFKRKHGYLFVQIILFGIYITYILRYWGLQHMAASKAAFLFNLSPFLASLYSYFFFKERMTLKQWIGLFIGFIGLIPILLTSSNTETVLGELYFISWPELAIIAAVACHSYSWVVMRKLVLHKNYSPAMVNGICMSAGGILALITSFITDGFSLPVNDIVPFSGLLACVILISNLICHNLYGFLLKRYTATFLSFAGFLGPLFTAFYGWIFLGETVTWHFYASSVIVFIGLFLFYQDELNQVQLDDNDDES